MTKIEPTVGRIVWYYAGIKDRRQAAIIVDVDVPALRYNDVRKGVLLYVFGQFNSGYVWVPTIEDPDEPLACYAYDGYATWMPYQKGQAAKTDALLQKLIDTSPDEAMDPIRSS